VANREHCQEVLDYLLAHPEKHAQCLWVAPPSVAETARDERNLCHTTACVAGTAALLSGRYDFDFVDITLPSGRIVHGLRELYDGKTWEEHEIGRDDNFDTDTWFCEAGAEYLGLDSTEAGLLFYEMDNETALLKLKEYANGEC
jgi:hypothetical protein